MTSTVTTVQRMFLNGALFGSYPTVALAEQAAAANGPGNYDIIQVSLDVITGNPVPPTESPAGTTVSAGTTAAIIDGAGNHWTITPTSQVAVNGVVDTTTSHVTELAFMGGDVWQQNAAKLWWMKTSPTDTWEPLQGTAVSPLAPPVTPIPPPATDAYVIYQNGKFNWPGDYSGNTAAIDYAHTGQALSPETECIQFTAKAPWAEWLPYSHANPGPFLDISKCCNGKQAVSLQFMFKATLPNQSISVYAISAGDVSPPSSVPGYHSPAGALPVGEWIIVNIPLSLMGLGANQAFSGNQFYKFAIQDQTGLSANVWYVDEVVLLP